MAEKPIKREGALNFVDSMLSSAKDTTEVKAQTRFDGVNPTDIEKVMANLKKGIVRK
ncbi:hypothetical protein J4444_02365 [Candidatus Woesearchaeota archaeon]|nr:hypothetical protein [Candidatus Woesearchaeota archaeon]